MDLHIDCRPPSTVKVTDILWHNSQNMTNIYVVKYIQSGPEYEQFPVMNKRLDYSTKFLNAEDNVMLLLSIIIILIYYYVKINAAPTILYLKVA